MQNKAHRGSLEVKVCLLCLDSVLALRFSEANSRDLNLSLSVGGGESDIKQTQLTERKLNRGDGSLAAVLLKGLPPMSQVYSHLTLF